MEPNGATPSPSADGNELLPVEGASLDVVRLKHPWRAAASGLVLVGIVLFVRGAATNEALQWDVVSEYLFNPAIMDGLRITLILTAVCMVVAAVLGTLVAVMRLSPSALLSWPAAIFVWFFRGVPVLVQLIFWFNLALLVRTVDVGLPWVGTWFVVQTNDFMTPFVAAVLGLGLHEAGYMAETVRAGISSVERGQTEAAGALGMDRRLTLRRIVLPQAMRLIVPPTGNATIGLLKTTSLVSVIAVGDLLNAAQNIYTRTFQTIPLLLVVTFWYLVVVTILSIGQQYVERYFDKDSQSQGTGSSLRGLFKSGFSFRRTETSQ